MLKIIKSIIIILLFNTALSAQNNFITLHEDCNYSGNQGVLLAGNYRAYQLKIKNDRLSSIQVPAGMKVTIYEHDRYKGKSKTFTGNVPCLDADWDNLTSSVVVENLLYPQGNNQNSYITFYNDCYNKGLSRTLKPGVYKGSALSYLKNKISSFVIYGNLRVRVYLDNENAEGYNQTFTESERCLSSSYNDKISSLVIEYNNNQNYNYNYGNNNSYNGNSSYATVYANCNYRGNSLSLQPGYYDGSKLGVLKFAISSIKMPSNLSAKVYLNKENISGNYYTVSNSISCLSSNVNNKIGAIVIEEKNPGSNNYSSSQSSVIIYSDANYKGQSVSLLPGTYSSMSQLNFPDNALSSLYLPPGFRVVLYEHPNFEGKKYTVTASKSGFLFSSWNDKTSSIAVYRN